MNSLRVLIIEDHREASNALALLLTGWGHEVLAAFSGPVGVQVAAAWSPRVVLCDIALPGLSGLEVARELRGNQVTAGVTLVAITGLGSDMERRAIQSGFDHFLAKPVDPELLRRLLEELG
jgi:two-component system OmpR family response regulator